MTKYSGSARAGQEYPRRHFISDEEYFRRNPNAIFRLRPWRNEDDEHVIGSRGCETEFCTASIVFRNGRIYAGYFPDPFCRRKRPLGQLVQYWALDMFEHEQRRQQP
jgi:hypothetical protein